MPNSTQSIGTVRTPVVWRCVALGCIVAASTVGCKQADQTTASDGSGSTAGEVVEAAAGEVEPNDTVQQATRLGRTGSVTGTVRGADVDHVRVETGAAGVLLSLTRDDSVVAVLVDPRDGVEHAWPVATRTWSLGMQRPWLVRFTGEGAWTLHASALEAGPPCGGGTEPDSAAEVLGTLRTVPGRLTGCMESGADIDHFRIAPEALVAEDAIGLYVEGVPGLSLQLTAFDDAGVTLAELIAGPGRPLALPSLRRPAQGGVNVQVRTFAGASDETPYVVDVRRVPVLNGTIESEPNDTPAQASLIDTVDIVSGWFHRPGDVDWYQLQTATDQVLRLTAEAAAGMDLQILLPEGTLFGPATLDEKNMAEPEQICSLRVGPDEPFVFAVRPRALDQAIPEPYVILFDILDATGFEREPNDRVDQLVPPTEGIVPAAQRVGIWGAAPEPGLSASGHLFPRGDVDHFIVEVFDDPLASVTYTSTQLTFHPNGPAIYSLELLDAAGATLGRATGTPDGGALEITLDLVGGRYLARVSMMSGEPCGPPYRLEVAQAPYGQPTTPTLPTLPPLLGAETIGGTSDGSGEGLFPNEGALPTPQPVVTPPGNAIPPPPRPAPRPVRPVPQAPTVRPRTDVVPRDVPSRTIPMVPSREPSPSLPAR